MFAIFESGKQKEITQGLLNIIYTAHSLATFVTGDIQGVFCP
jgi:hypothetical protein